MYECIRHGVDFVLAGSIRDDGPLPETMMDLLEAQERYAAALEGVKLVIVLSTMLHGIGVGEHAAIVGDGWCASTSIRPWSPSSPIADRTRPSASSPTSASSCISCTGGWSSPPGHLQKQPVASGSIRKSYNPSTVASGLSRKLQRKAGSYNLQPEATTATLPKTAVASGFSRKAQLRNPVRLNLIVREHSDPVFFEADYHDAQALHFEQPRSSIKHHS